MAESPDLNSLSSRLLAQDSLVAENEYRDYREKLARSLDAARRNERIAYWVCAVSGVISNRKECCISTRALVSMRKARRSLYLSLARSHNRAISVRSFISPHYRIGKIVSVIIHIY